MPTCRAGSRASGWPRPLPGRRARARRRGLQLPAGRGRRHEHRVRVRDVAHGIAATGLGHPDLATLRMVPWQGHRPGHVRLAVGGRQPGVAVTPGGAAAAAGAAGRAGLGGLRRHRARVHLFRDSYEEAFAKGYRDLRPANDYNVDYSLLGTARIEPLLRRIRNSMAGAGCRSSRPRASATTASTRSPSATPTPWPPPTGSHLQERGQGDRRPGRLQPDLHGQVQRARGQLLPHPLQPARR